MFGIIPKVMWEKVAPADDDNLIEMVTNLFVLSAHGENVLFDAGLGEAVDRDGPRDDRIPRQGFELVRARARQIEADQVGAPIGVRVLDRPPHHRIFVRPEKTWGD